MAKLVLDLYQAYFTCKESFEKRILTKKVLPLQIQLGRVLDERSGEEGLERFLKKMESRCMSLTERFKIWGPSKEEPVEGFY